MKALLLLVITIGAAFPAHGEEANTFPVERARILPASSADAAEAMAAVLEDLGFRLRVNQPKDGVFVTKPAFASRVAKHGLTVPQIGGVRASEVEVHAYVSRALEPSHVHVEAIITSVGRADGTSAHAYSLGVVERQVLDALEMRLGVRGQAMPDMLEDRRRTAASLGPVAECVTGKLQVPEIIASSKLRPIFPANPLRERESGRVMVLARILSDGSTVPVRILSGSGTAHSKDMETACLAAVGFWRYRPARNGSCPIDVPMTIAVDFNR